MNAGRRRRALTESKRRFEEEEEDEEEMETLKVKQDQTQIHKERMAVVVRGLSG